MGTRDAAGAAARRPGVGPTGLEVTPDGHYLIAARIMDGISVFGIGEDGALTAGTNYPETPPGVSAGLACNCAGTLLFDAEANSLISGFGYTVLGIFSLSNGLLTPLPGSPFQFHSGINSNYVALSADDRYAFVSNQETSSVTVLEIAQDGQPSLKAGSPYVIPGYLLATGLSLNEKGDLLYVASGSTRFGIFKVGQDGSLTLAPGAPFWAGTLSHGMMTVAAYPPRTCCPAPVVENVSATPADIWPVNRKLIEVEVNYEVTGGCSPVATLGVSSEGGSPEDWEVVDAHHVLLRAERAGNEGDRVYDITVSATNPGNGRTGTAVTQVLVRHDARP